MSGALISALGEFTEASFNGVPFATMGNEGAPGRKLAVHEYPFRDTPWPEDIGRKSRVFRVRGFVVGPTAYVQRDLMVLAVETPGPGLLIHSTIGIKRVAVRDFVWREPDGRSGVVEFEFEFIEQSSFLTTTVQLALDAVVAAVSIAAAAAAGGDYATDTSSSFALGAAVTSAATTTAASWAAIATTGSTDAALIAGAVKGLVGSYGRYDGGHAAAQPATATVETLLQGLTAARATLALSVVAIASAAGAANTGATVAALPEAFRATIYDPADQIRLLTPLARFTTMPIMSSAPIGAAVATVQTATATLCRRSALLSIALAAAAYQPTSYEDAQMLRANLASLFQVEIIAAADGGDDASYQALRQLRTAVLKQLAQVATQLPTLIEVTRNAPLPSLVLAEQLYSDATRASDLIARANPVHPAFMPTSFMAASS